MKKPFKKKTPRKPTFEKISDPTIKNFLLEETKKKNVNPSPIFGQQQPKTESIISVKNLYRSFDSPTGKKVVLDDISFEIYSGEHLVILGKNGAGKTTLSEILSGINKQTSGTVEYHFPYKKNFVEGIGIKFQEANYPVGISVREILNFSLSINNHGINEEDLLALLDIFGVDEFYYKSSYSLSEGQKQRVNALVSLLHRPKVLFLDELSTGFDVEINRRIRSFIRRFAEDNGITLILVSHDIDEIEYFGKRIIFMDQGKIIVDLRVEEMAEKNITVSNILDKYI